MGCLKLAITKAPFLGLVLLLTLVSILVPLPARAGQEADTWSKYPIPRKGKAGDWVLTGGGTSVTAISVAFDGTIYAATEETAGSPLNGYNLFKSTDDGYSWKHLWKIPARDNPNGDAKVIALILPRWEDADTLYLATQYNIYRSTDGWEHITGLSPPPSTSGTITDHNALISSFAVTDYEGTHLIVAGTRDADPFDYGGVYFYDESQVLPSWADLRVGNDVAGNNYDVLAVAFSPDFADDRQVVAVVTDETDTIVTTKLGGGDWGDIVGDAHLLDPTSTPWAATKASLVFPADYDSDASGNRYVQYVGIDVDETSGGVYMIVGAETPNDSVVIPLFAPAPVHSMAIAGEAFDATIVAGLTSGDVIFTFDGDLWIPSYP